MSGLLYGDDDLSTYQDYERYVDPTLVYTASHQHVIIVLIILALVILGYVWELNR